MKNTPYITGRISALHNRTLSGTIAFIDTEYRTLPDRDHTAVAGASMGGGISFYMAWAYPDVFFGAACLSLAFLYKQDRFTLNMVEKTDPPPDLRLFLYCGQGDDLERLLTGDVHAMCDAPASKGFSPGSDTLVVLEYPEGTHNEASWARHTDHWLLFLFREIADAFLR